MNQFDYKETYRRNLPHLQPPEATLFVTFRLDGSLPKPVLEQWRVEKKQLEMKLLRWAAMSPPGTKPDPVLVAEEKLKFRRRWFKKFEDVLDGAATGPVWLQEERVASIVNEALRERDDTVFRLDAYCVMPNHVHVVLAPFLTEAQAQQMMDNAIRQRKDQRMVLAPEVDDEAASSVLASIMQSLKGWTAYQGNRVLERRGQFWQHESYDHVIRSQAEWERVVNYVINNPVKAGLATNWQDWPWSYHRQPKE